MSKFMCITCGNISQCGTAGVLHIYTTHLYLDIHVSDEHESYGKKCNRCLLNNTVPYPELKVKQKGESE